MQGSRLSRHAPIACARKLLGRSLSEAGMSPHAIARKLGVSRRLIDLRSLVSITTKRLGLKFPPAKFIVCSVCGWRGMSSQHNPERCAWFLRLRQMREAGLPRLAIVRELRISYSMFLAALRLLGLTATKSPK